MQPKKGKAMLETGNYVTVWQRQADGSWKIVRDISNSDRAGM
jgi:ketosteroid isomerase-like protein